MPTSRGSTDSEILRSVRAVLDIELRALASVRGAVGANTARAVRLLAGCRGKVIVTGVGKSGLIAQKIAATLASTGTPAIYLHPVEGLHGDLGLVERRDLILAVGKSGESPELNALLPAIRRIGCRLVALTAAPRSTLARGADAVLHTPIEREACPLDLAPTSSTTAAVAVGDAVAVALMKLRGFRREHFALLHPGGQLGKRLTLRVSDVMRSRGDNPVVRSDAGFDAMLVEMTRKHAGAVNVVDRSGRLVGLITDYDLRRALEHGEVRRLPLAKVMNPSPTRIRVDRPAIEAVELMARRKNPFNVLPVVDARGKSVGLVQVHDLRALGL